tara:strand:- start:179 stop:334 length:156 start_codon:yes stop_codon:yes gene_type:complete
MKKDALMGFAVTAVAVVAGLYLFDYIKDSGSSTSAPAAAATDPMMFRGRRR